MKFSLRKPRLTPETALIIKNGVGDLGKKSWTFASMMFLITMKPGLLLKLLIFIKSFKVIKWGKDEFFPNFHNDKKDYKSADNFLYKVSMVSLVP